MKYQVEFSTSIYATVTVDADSAEEAAELADQKFYTEIAGPGAGVVDTDSGRYDGKGWEINSVTDENGETEYS